MKSVRLFVWHVVLVLSVCLLVESESEIRQCEALQKTIELSQGFDLQSGLKEWRQKRSESIKTLKDLREKLDMICLGSNYCKGTGIVAQVVGAIASIVGSVLELAGLPGFRWIMKFGDLIHHLGSLVDGMSRITEPLGSAKYLNDVENILKKDKQLSTSLGNSLEAWKSLEEKMEEIFGSDQTSENWIRLLNSVVGKCSKIWSITNNFKDTIDALKGGEYSTYIETEKGIDWLLKFSHYLGKNYYFNRVSAIVKSYKNCTGKEISEKMASIPQEYKPPTVNTVAKYTFWRSIDIAENYMSLLDVTKVIKEGKSKYSDSLQEIINILEMELKNMEIS